jgi:hypothetical protein
VRAAGDDGSTITVGSTFLDVQTGTYLSDSANNNTVLTAVSSSAGGQGAGTALVGVSGSGYGVSGSSDSNAGVNGQSSSNIGVHGQSSSNIGVYGQSSSYIGVYGQSSATNRPASLGQSYGDSSGVQGYSGSGIPPAARAKTGVYGYAAQDSSAKGIYGESPAGWGGYFAGKVYVSKFQEMPEISTPSAPGLNKARLFVRDNGGFTQLCVRFNTGGVKVLATQT